MTQKRLTHSVHKEFRLRREVVIDNIVQHWNINASGLTNHGSNDDIMMMPSTYSDISDEHDHSLLVDKLSHIDFPGCLVQGTVDAGTRDPSLLQQLHTRREGRKERGERVKKELRRRGRERETHFFEVFHVMFGGSKDHRLLHYRQH